MPSSSTHFTIKFILILAMLLLNAVPDVDAFAEENGTEQNDLLSTTTEPKFLIRQIRFEGNKSLNRKTLSDTLNLREGEQYTRAEIINGFQRLLAEYRRAGFVFAKLTPESVTVPAKQNHKLDRAEPEQVSIQVKINEGKRIRIGQLTFKGNQLFSQTDIHRELDLKRGQLFTETVLQEGIDRIQALYSQQGHPKVEIELTDVKLSAETSTIDFQLQIREGTEVRLSEIKLSGLKKTKTHVVTREIPVKVGQRFNQRKIDQSYHRLRNLGYFYQVHPNLLEAGATDDTIIFHAKLTEARTGRLSGILGYAPPAENVDSVPQLTGVLELREENLMGTGRAVNIYWKSGLLKTLRLGYKEPWVFGKPVTLGVGYSQRKQRNPFTAAESEEKSANVSLATDFGRSLAAEVMLGYKQIRFAGILSPLLLTTSLDTQFPNVNTQTEQTAAPVERGTKYSLTLRFTRDTRDYFLNPTHGRRDSIAVEVSRSDFKLRKVWLDLQQYFPTWKNQTIAIELHGAAAWGVNIPPTELFYLGGANTLRGYDEDWFSGPRRAYANFEYRLLIGRQSQLFTFVDLGAVTLKEQPAVFDKLRVGYGFGVRLESRGGILQLDYGLAAGDSALRGKIHVQLGAAF